MLQIDSTVVHISLTAVKFGGLWPPDHHHVHHSGGFFCLFVFLQKKKTLKITRWSSVVVEHSNISFSQTASHLPWRWKLKNPALTEVKLVTLFMCTEQNMGKGTKNLILRWNQTFIFLSFSLLPFLSSNPICKLPWEQGFVENSSKAFSLKRFIYKKPNLSV